jgi:hypothetical protein
VRIHNLSGGYLTTSEHLDLLASLIRAPATSARRPAANTDKPDDLT